MFLLKHGSFWHVQFRDSAGKTKRVTTKKKSEQEAEIWLEDNKYRFDENLKDSPLTQANVHSIIRQQLELKEIPKPKFTFAELKSRILKHNEVNICKNSAQIYSKVLSEFEKVISSKTYLDDIDEFDIETYKKTRINDVEKMTVNRDIVSLRTIFKLAIKWKMMKENPALNIKKFTIEQKEIRIFTPDEIDKLRIVMEKEKFYHFIKIMEIGLFTGCRLNEILNLQWQDIDLENRKIIIKNKENFRTKTGKIRVIPISDKLFCIIQKMFPKIYNADELLFHNSWKQTYSKSWVSRQFKYFILKAGLNSELHFHCLRHTFISTLIQNGIPLAKVQKLAGHSNISTTLIYTHLFVEDLRNEVNCINF